LSDTILSCNAGGSKATNNLNQCQYFWDPTFRCNLVELVYMSLLLSFRALCKTPAVTGIIVVTLALGIGVTTAIFSLVKAVLLNPLAYGQPDHLVILAERSSNRPENPYVDAVTVEDWKERSHSFENIALYTDMSLVLLENGRAEIIRGLQVNYNFFDTLGVKMQLGRNFLPEEDSPDRNAGVVILSYGAWARRFGKDPAILGRVLHLSGGQSTVIGVLPADFPELIHGTVELPPEMYRPVGYDFSPGCRRCQDFRAVARLRPGVGVDQAQVELNMIMRTIAHEYPGEYESTIGVSVRSVSEYLLGRVRAPLLAVSAAGGFVMLIACVNVASLLLTRGTARAREIAMRAVLGAGRRRLISQLLNEALVLSLPGAIGGLLLALGGTRSIGLLLPTQIPRFDKIHIDGMTLLFTLGAGLFTTIATGLVPAWFATGIDLNDVLKASSKSAIGGRWHRLHAFLVITELALAFVLVLGAGLMARSFMLLMSVNPGFDSHNVLTLTAHVWGSRYWHHPGKEQDYYQQALERVREVPGVEGAAWTSVLPLDYSFRQRLQIEDRPTDTKAEPPVVDSYSVSKDYFRVLRIPLKRGRIFESHDNPGSQRVALISESCARRVFSGEDPIGKHIQLGELNTTQPWATIVGIVGDIRQNGLDQPSNMEAYVAQEQDLVIEYYRLVARTNLDPHGLESAIRAAFMVVDSTLPVDHIKSLEEYLAGTLSVRRLALVLVGSFGMIALGLGALGIYGVISYTVTLRRQEMGIRLALGAQRTTILLAVLGNGLTLTAIGLATGFVLSLMLNRFLSSLLFEIRPLDFPTLSAMTIVLLVVALLASWVPARRAASVDPALAPRDE
jgi:putative ABC transport system permease protein